MGIAHRRRLLRRRRQRAPRAPGRRGGADRPGRRRASPTSTATRSSRSAKADRRRGDPSRLRLPVGERRRSRRSLRAGRHRLHRPAGRGDPRDGLEVRGQGADGEGRRAARARATTATTRIPTLLAERGGAHRLSGADQGERRRRRQGHAARRRAGRFRRRARVVPARGEERVRRRPRAGREVRPAAAPHRDPGLRRHARQLRLPVRARLLGAAAPPEGARGGARARHDAPSAAPRWARPRSRRRKAVGYVGAGTVEFIADPRTAASTSWR